MEQDNRMYLKTLIDDIKKYILEAKLEMDVETDLYEYLTENEISRQRFSNVMGLVVDEKLNEAENELFEILTPGDKDILLLGLHFYSYINHMSDEYLSKHGFSREEIRTGLKDFLNEFGFNEISEDYLDIR